MASCRFAFAVHILAVLARHGAGGVTSQALAGSVNTNPVVIRRILAQLQRAGLVSTQKGAGAGSRIARQPDEISLGEVYRAVEPAPAFGVHPQQPNQRCCVGREIQRALGEVFAGAQEALEQALARRTLADIAEKVGAAEPTPSLRARPTKRKAS
ncbi:MAG TPA: Rrf2 family transcriptional regulator [Chthoniobacteraceae bacterium]|jgi:Rrf2 family protein